MSKLSCQRGVCKTERRKLIQVIHHYSINIHYSYKTTTNFNLHTKFYA